MKISLSKNEMKKAKGNYPSKKNSHTDSLIYKEITTQMENMFTNKCKNAISNHKETKNNHPSSQNANHQLAYHTNTVSTAVNNHHFNPNSQHNVNLSNHSHHNQKNPHPNSSHSHAHPNRSNNNNNNNNIYLHNNMGNHTAYINHENQINHVNTNAGNNSHISAVNSKKNSGYKKKSSKASIPDYQQSLGDRLVNNFLAVSTNCPPGTLKLQEEEAKGQMATHDTASQKGKRECHQLDSNPVVRKNSSLMKNRLKLEAKGSTQKIQKKMFNYQYIIGKGGFGKVWRVSHVKTKNNYAMKQMMKSIVMAKKSVQSVMNERMLLSQISSSFIVNMHYSFQDRDTLYLVLDFMEGGDLRHHISNHTFNETQAKFFIACIILGLEHLRSCQIIHRDIKPENLVLDARGYIRITDLGIARIYRPNNSSDTSGTPGYMSPQVICRLNHSYVSDYFALGVIAYELMTNKRPYNGRNRNEVREFMLSKQAQLKASDLQGPWSLEAIDFVNQLIKRKPEQRLGANGIHQIKNHSWVRSLNWQKLKNREIESPFIPVMRKKHFDQNEEITVEDEEEVELIEKNALLLRKPQFQQLFKGYYYDQNDGLKTGKQPKRKSQEKKQQHSKPRTKNSIGQHYLGPYNNRKKLSQNETTMQRSKELNANVVRHYDQMQTLNKEKRKSAKYPQKSFFKDLNN